MISRSVWLPALLFLVAAAAPSSELSPLYRRGYAVIPDPQRVELQGSDFPIDATWAIRAGPGVTAGDSAIESLSEQLARRWRLKLGGAGHGSAIELSIKPGAVEIGNAADRDRATLAEQAYRLVLRPGGIVLSANAGAGLYYGVQTLMQLVRPHDGKYWLPGGEIVDWPDVGLREVFWDDQERLDRFEVLQQAIDRAAFFKINAFTLRLNNHFEYASAPALVDPYALTAAQLQALTDYGLRRYVQVIPYLDGPAHANFILERDEFKRLRSFPESAFEMCTTNPDTYRLLEGLARDLITANRGVKYFHLSTDEAWFIGKADNAQCNETVRAKELGSPSRLWVEFTQKVAGYLENLGRKVIIWGEEPLQAEDIPRLPSGLINGEVYSAAYNKAFRAHGIRQMIYTNSQPDDPLFPAYSVLAPKDRLRGEAAAERASQVYQEISFTSARQDADIMGAGVYAWADNGPHPETFWLGYATGASAAWHPGSRDPREIADGFYRLYYGRGALNMGRLYQLMSTQAQFWTSSWDSEPSTTLPLIFGYSYGIGPFTPHISTLPLPPVPSAGYLRLGGDWRAANARRVELAWKFLGENDELLDLLYRNLSSVEWNRHNLEVYLSIAKVCRQNLTMLLGLDDAARQLASAQEQAARLRYADAVAALDSALDSVRRIRDDRNQVLRDLTATWYETMQPRVREANGRHVAREPQRFVDTASSEIAHRSQEGLLYVIDREFLLPLGDWFAQVQEARNRYAAAHGLPARQGRFDWQDTATLHGQAIDREL